VNVAPSDDFVFNRRGELQTAFLDEVHHEFAHLRQRRCFQEREVFSFACHDLERAMKTLDLPGACRDDGEAPRWERAGFRRRPTISESTTIGLYPPLHSE
jgi:hypothetical protein